ncbi:hypothetical protein LCGC14_2986800, partial [marine sediment metagenome]
LVDGKLQSASRRFVVQRPYRPWIDYHAFIWAHYQGAHADLIRQAGYDGTIGPQSGAIEADLAFYPDNISYETFAYYHKRRDEHNAIRQAWAKHPDNRPLHHRRPSLTSEGTWERFTKRMNDAIERSARYRPVFYNMADEIGIADQSAVSDLDWEYSSRDAWRDWLQNEYRTVGALNRQWESNHASWAKVRGFFPSTHYMYDRLWADVLLARSFGTIEKFNRAFGTGYKSFADVVAGYAAVRTDDEGMTAAGLTEAHRGAAGVSRKLRTAFKSVDDAAAYLKKFEQWVARQDAADTRGWNLSWWCDFREYMDEYMARGLARARDIADLDDLLDLFQHLGRSRDQDAVPQRIRRQTQGAVGCGILIGRDI